ncbi:MAG: cell division FtsA domain-containing protein [Deltaproteobacteria bacterium]|nr:cell division FtsA domain-containing protein [Deltaproteobacteria bacterium]
MSTDGREIREVSRRTLGEIIEPRAEEILRLVHREILKSEMAERDFKIRNGGFFRIGSYFNWWVFIDTRYQ